MLLNGNAATHNVIISGERIHLAILGNGYRDILGERQQHGIVGGLFSHGVAPVGEKLVLGAGVAVVVRGHGSDHSAGGKGFVPDHHGISAAVHNFKNDAREIRIALGLLTSFAIPLLNRNTAPDHLIGSSGGVVIELIVGASRDLAKVSNNGAHLVALASADLLEAPIFAVREVISGKADRNSRQHLQP